MPELPEWEKFYCPECKLEISKDEQTCPHCGTNLVKPPEIEVPEEDLLPTTEKPIQIPTTLLSITGFIIPPIGLIVGAILTDGTQEHQQKAGTKILLWSSLGAIVMATYTLIGFTLLGSTLWSTLRTFIKDLQQALQRLLELRPSPF